MYSANCRQGSLGTAIVQGILANKQRHFDTSTIKVTVTSQASATALKHLFEARPQVSVFEGHNASVAADSDVIILACPPTATSEVLSETGLRHALRGKLLISVLGGVTRQTIEDTLLNDQTPERCWVVRALPNLAVASNASATAIEVSDPRPPKHLADLADAIFSDLGGIVHVPSSLMDASTVLCGSAPAFVALFLDGMIDGAVAAGVPREKADVMVAQMLMSTSMLLKDQRASTLRESICAMPGCTVQGNLALEEGGARGISAKAMKVAIEAASKLG
ncbi:pyrroline-5-carboxylate reductase [Cyphellophora europaea CBS 101466]|uniref:Pyrroline-5-carboxylate reductase n=1 Tax=Cyphellophora europaea (strain CBS 101466) TaxID=1220924 RepID=W2RTL3_CYPE1|nr:pyrroline-5-carboxylate reductase [Cyphellophora europaea CBS 101466]ETN39049.1 pyrroline-5-carboxylate reductase [Cyphellophora europaea CBS 101466]